MVLVQQESVVWVPATGANNPLLEKYGILARCHRRRGTAEERELVLPEGCRVVEQPEYAGKLDILCLNHNLNRYERKIVVRRDDNTLLAHCDQLAAVPLVTKVVPQLYIKLRFTKPTFDAEKLGQIDPKILKNLVGCVCAVVRDNHVIDELGHAKQIYATARIDATDRAFERLTDEATNWLNKNHAGWRNPAARFNT